MGEYDHCSIAGDNDNSRVEYWHSLSDENLSPKRRWKAAHLFWKSLLVDSKDFFSKLPDTSSHQWDFVRTILLSETDRLSQICKMEWFHSVGNLALVHGYLTAAKESDINLWIFLKLTKCLLESLLSHCPVSFDALTLLRLTLRKLTTASDLFLKHVEDEIPQFWTGLHCLVRCFWDDADAARLTKDLFHFFLDHQALSQDEIHSWLQFYIERIPWFLKGKWNLMSVLFRRHKQMMDRDQLGRLLLQIKRGLEYQHLSRSVTEIFTEILARFNRTSDEELIVSTVIECLLSSDKSLRRNAARHWVPVLAERNGRLLQWLRSELGRRCLETGAPSPWESAVANLSSLSHLSWPEAWSEEDGDLAWVWCSRDLALFAWILTSDCGLRKGSQQLRSELLADLPLLHICLVHPCNEIRLQAFSVEIQRVAGAWPVIDASFERVALFLRENASVDDSTFRQSVLTAFSGLCASFSSKRSEDCGQFLTGVLSDALAALFPGANFQRCYFSLRVVQISYDILSSEKSGYFSKF